MTGLFTALLDDAAVFPPGLAPLARAVPEHRAHRAGPYRDLVGPLVVGAGMLGDLIPLVGDLPAGDLALAVTVPAPDAVTAVLATIDAVPALHAHALEVAVPGTLAAEQVCPALASALAGRPDPPPTVFVEVPRDDRRSALLAALAQAGHRAKFRTGGVQADLYPDEAELADAITACAGLDLPFKATAGLHHAVRNTDPATGFEQHGFLNVLLATHVAAQAGTAAAVREVLADRDGHALADRLSDLTREQVAAARARFTSFGTCSVAEPVADLADLHLIDSPEGHPA